MVVPYCQPKSNILVMCGCNPFILIITDACTHKPGMTQSSLVFFSLCQVEVPYINSNYTPGIRWFSKEKWKPNMSLETSRKLRFFQVKRNKTAVFVFVGKAVSPFFFSHFGVISPIPPFPRPWFGPPSHWGPYFSLHPLWRDAKAGVLFGWNKSEFCDVFCSKTKCDSWSKNQNVHLFFLEFKGVETTN